MFVPFSTLPPTARVWIYQANRNFSASEAAAIEQRAQAFAQEWTAHRQALQASAEVRHGAFLILAVNEEAHGASGCSIDSSVHFIKELEQAYGVSFFDRTQLAFLQNGEVERVPLAGMRQAAAAQHITPDTLFFNNLAATKTDLETQWLVPAGNSWLAKYFTSLLSHDH